MNKSLNVKVLLKFTKVFACLKLINYFCILNLMKDWFFAILCNYIKYTKGFISKWRKGELRVVRFENVKVCMLNDFPNRRVLVWYYYEPTKQLNRIAYHGYYAKYLSNKVAHTARLINENDEFREVDIHKRGSYSFGSDKHRKANKPFRG